VRSGDFILNMVRTSENLNEYAFALGALSHYAADNDGHSMATNASVPLLYPKLRIKFGNRITYADDPFSHSKTEFGFDVFQAAKRRYASDEYKAFIGFEVAKPVLERAFLETYGMPIEKVFLSFDLAIGSYRRAVGSVLPAMTRIAWQINKQEIRKDVPGITRKKFLYNLSRSSYEKNWGSTYTKLTRRSQILAFVFRIVPKVGPFKPLAYKPLTPEIEKLYMASVNATLDRYVTLLSCVKSDRLDLPNVNFDVGDPTAAGKYRLADSAYAKLLHKLKDQYAVIPPDLRADLLAYYSDLTLPIFTRTSASDWRRLTAELSQLNAVSLDLSEQVEAASEGQEAGNVQ
jgi:Zinc dependent phospholipase C